MGPGGRARTTRKVRMMATLDEYVPFETAGSRSEAAKFGLSPGVQPARLVEIELADNLPALEAASDPRGSIYHRALALVRLHGDPVGLIEVPLREGAITPDELGQVLWPAIRRRAARHLREDDESATIPSGLSLTGPAVVVDGTPRCVDRRRAFLKAADPVTVLIPSRERPERLRRCLESVLSCEFPLDKLSVIVVDNAPVTDATRQLVASYEDRVDIRYVREDLPGSASARNRGLKEVTTEIVLMTDDDVVVDSQWICEVARTFAEHPDAATVSGLIVPMELDTPAQIWFEQWGGFGRGLEQRIFDLAEHWPEDEPLHPWTAGYLGNGNNFSFRTAAVKEIGGFDPALGNGTPALGGVDTEILLRTILNRHKIVYQPRAIVHHAHRADYEALRRQIFGYGSGLTALWLKTLFTNPSLSIDFARKIPGGLRFALSTSSEKNVLKKADYPTELTRLELRGMVYGPIAYARSRRKYGRHSVPRVRRLPAAPAEIRTARPTSR